MAEDSSDCLPRVGGIVKPFATAAAAYDSHRRWRAEGRRLRTPRTSHSSHDGAVREALFNILGELRPGCVVWDLCAGSGALAWKRCRAAQVRRCLSIVMRRPVACCVKPGLARVGDACAGGGAFASALFCTVARTSQSRSGFCSADPPYAGGELPKLLAWLSSDGAACLAPDCRVVIEDGCAKPWGLGPWHSVRRAGLRRRPSLWRLPCCCFGLCPLWPRTNRLV